CIFLNRSIQYSFLPIIDKFPNQYLPVPFFPLSARPSSGNQWISGCSLSGNNIFLMRRFVKPLYHPPHLFSSIIDLFFAVKTRPNLNFDFPENTKICSNRQYRDLFGPFHFHLIFCTLQLLC